MLRYSIGDYALSSIPTGFLTGMVSSIFFSSQSLSIYLSWKTLEVRIESFVMGHPVFVLFALHVFQILCRMGVSSGFLPKIPLTIEVLYATATAILFHLAVVRPHGLKPSYFRFMNKITGNRYADIFY